VIGRRVLARRPVLEQAGSWPAEPTSRQPCRRPMRVDEKHRSPLLSPYVRHAASKETLVRQVPRCSGAGSSPDASFDRGRGRGLRTLRARRTAGALWPRPRRCL